MRFFNETPDERINRYSEFLGTTYRPVENTTTNIDAIKIPNTVAGFLSGLNFRTKPRLNNDPVKEVSDAVEETKEVVADEKLSTTPTILELTDSRYNPLTFNDGRLPTPVTPTPMMGSFLENVKRAIGGVESTENYSAHRWDTGKGGRKGSGAWGKYQFIGGIHGTDIKKVTGLGLNDFLKSPDAQESFFEWHLANNVMPTVEKIKEQVPDHGMSDVELAAAVHYRGPSALQAFKQGTLDKKGIAGNPTNPSINQHVAKVRRYLDENPLV